MFCFRLNDPDAEHFRRNVAKSNLNQQQYIERCVLDKPIVSIDRVLLHQIFVELSRQGNNINQMARICNETGRPPAADALNRVREVYENIWQRLKQLVLMQA